MATEERIGQQVAGSVEVLGDDDEEGVLLYYKFVQILEPERTKGWLFGLSSSLGLLGRIRVAYDGINVTVGGKMKALHEHIELVGADPLFEGTDFKLASSVPNANRTVAAECGFTSLSARIVKELVTLGLPSSVRTSSLFMAGKHVTAHEFHKILQDSPMVSEAKGFRDSAGDGRILPGNGVDSPVSPDSVTDHGTGSKDEDSMTLPLEEQGETPHPKKIVVVDARNIYETRIGKFCPPEGVEVMDPRVRQYSDLPRWIDDHEDHLRNNQILMYCTGGVRCEMASAYIRSKGKEFEDVYQLSGGIQRYLEAFSNGGYFFGKNFVFDHRLAVPSSNQEVVGSCLLCQSRFDDYSFRCRCSSCRMLVLVCGACQVTPGQEQGGRKYICELCSEEKKTALPERQGGSQPSEGCILSHDTGVPFSESRDEVRHQRLKILCLHGFRQSASSLKGRLNALRKKLRQQVEFVYVDAPHEVLCRDHSPVSSCADGTTGQVARNLSKKFAWLISPEKVAGDVAAITPQSLVGEAALVTRGEYGGAQLGNGAAYMDDSTINKPEFVTKRDDCDMTLRNAPTASSSLECRREHSLANRGHSEGRTERLKSISTILQSTQYLTQTEGWPRSWTHLKRVFTELGPFDGVLGFSQGAAVAAALCSRSSPISRHHEEQVSFKFAILCSGFFSPAFEHPTTAINCASLHIFGGRSGHDRQIGGHESEKLASLFKSGNLKIVRHDMGHIIPTQPEYVQQYLEFLSTFIS